MGWSIGYDSKWNRDIGYGVIAYCDHPKCNETIDRGLAHVCADEESEGGEYGCGLYFCAKHHRGFTSKSNFCCPRCAAGKPPYKRPKPEHPHWLYFKLHHSSWAEWREENPEKVAEMREAVRGKDIPLEIRMEAHETEEWVASEAE